MTNDYETKETDFGTQTSHPSFGTLRFSKIYGGPTSLFGSSIEHSNTVELEIFHADVTRGLHQDTYFGSKPILRAEMSYSQFAEAITSFGNGTGIPITIRFTEKDGRIPRCDFVSKRQQFVEEFEEERKSITEGSEQLLKDVESLFMSKKTFTKADKEDIIKKLQKLSQDLGCNMDFIASQFNEQMDKTVMEAKGEIEAFCQNKINSIANGALVAHRDELLSLENPVSLGAMTLADGQKEDSTCD